MRMYVTVTTTEMVETTMGVLYGRHIRGKYDK